jgi:tetratricopeptide (TPR) repeat protein
MCTAMDEPLICWRVLEPSPALSARKVLPLLRTAAAAAPHRRDVHIQLARALFDSDRMAELVDCARPFVAESETEPEVLYLLGRAALAIHDYDLAVAALRAAAERGFAHAHTYLCEALLKADRIDAAIAAGLQGLEHPTQDFKCLFVLAHALLLDGQRERLWTLCVDLRTRGAWGGYFPAVLAAAAEAVGRTDQVAALLDPTRWFSAAQLAVPKGFNGNLAAELLAHKSLGAWHSTRATRGTGTWINHLDLCGGPLAQQLLAMIRTAAEGYIRDRQAFADHPIMARRPRCANLKCWASELHSDGFQSPHIHPAGWLSGVYYVTVPTVDPASDGHAGAIEFGLLSLGEKLGAPRVARWRVMPEPGLMLFFPSYFAHWTQPTETAEPRISIAFDVVPGPEET